MEYLNRDRLQSLPPQSFQNRKPFPWLQIDNILTREGHALLRRTLLSMDQFECRAGVPRAHRQTPHDRYLLHYQPGLQVAEPWLEFVSELQGPVYKAFLRQMFGQHTFLPTFEWFYAWNGCDIAPQCDAARKLATHIFYFNTEEDWNPEWGGQILILDDERRFSPSSEPRFEQFKIAAAVESSGNGSLLLQRTQHAWHGVRPLICPPDKLHRLFIVTLNLPGLQVWWRGFRGQDADGYNLKAA